MRKLIIFLFCFGSITGLALNSGFCQSIEDILNNSSLDSPPAEDSADQSVDAAGDSAGSEATKSQFSIQFGVFKSQGAADQQLIELKTEALDPYIFQSTKENGQTVYAVRIGRFDSYAEAKEKQAEVENSVNIPSLIARYDSLSIAAPAGPEDESIQMAEKSDIRQQETTEADRTESGELPALPEEGSAGEESLMERINRLEAELNQMKQAEKVRENLGMTEAEAREEEEDILEAVEEEVYTLTGEGNLRFSYGFGYSYSEYNAIKESVRVEDVANHTIRNSFSTSYGVKDNLTLGTSIPFVYKYHRVGTVGSKEQTDLGDLSLNWRYQPIKSRGDKATYIVNGGFNVPVGRSPYEIDAGEELSTSSGIYSTRLGVSVSKTTDPVVVFSSFSTTYRLPVEDIGQKRGGRILDEVDPGMGFGIGAGLGYALSYKLNLNLSFSYSYSFETKYHYKNSESSESGTSASASMSLGVGYRLTPKQNLNFRFGIPITRSGSFSFSLSTPIEFKLQL